MKPQERAAPYQALLDAARAGSKEAVQELFDKWVPSILIVVRHRMKSRIRSILDSTDILQEICLRLFSHNLPAGIFESNQTFLAYVIRTAVNKIHEMNRKYLVLEKHNLNNEVPLEVGQRQEEHLVGAQQPERDIVHDEYLQKLARDLPGPLGEILLLLTQGYTQAEISEAMDIPERTLRRLVHRLRVKLGEHLIPGDSDAY